jgi:hypothetical protein
MLSPQSAVLVARVVGARSAEVITRGFAGDTGGIKAGRKERAWAQITFGRLGARVPPEVAPARAATNRRGPRGTVAPMSMDQMDAPDLRPRDTPGNAECVLRIRFPASLSAWQPQDGGDQSPRATGKRSPGATQLSTWTSTRPGRWRRDSRSATTSPPFWQPRTASTSPTTSTATGTSLSCSPGPRNDEASLKTPGSAGGSSPSTNSKGCAMDAITSVPVIGTGHRKQRATRSSCALPKAADRGYCVCARTDTSVHGGCCDCLGSSRSASAPANPPSSHHPGRFRVGAPVTHNGSACRRGDDRRSASISHFALGRGHRTGKQDDRTGPRDREGEVQHLAGLGMNSTKGLARILADSGEALRSGTTYRTCQHTCVHGEGSADERDWTPAG